MALSQKRKVSEWRKRRTTKTQRTNEDAKIIASTSKQTLSSQHHYYLRSDSKNKAKGSVRKQNKHQLRPKRPRRKQNYSVKNTAGNRVKRASLPKISVKSLESSLQKSVKDVAKSRRTVLKRSSTKLVGKRKPLGQIRRSKTSERQVSRQSIAVFPGESSGRADNRTLDKIVPSSSRTMSGRGTRQAIKTDSGGKRILPRDNSPTASGPKSSVSKRTSGETQSPSSKPVSQTLKRTLPFNSVKATFAASSDSTRSKTTSSTGSKKLKSNSKNALPEPAVASTSTSPMTRRGQKINEDSTSVHTPKPTRQGHLMGDRASASTASSTSTSPRPKTGQTSPSQAQNRSPPAINYQYPKLADLSKRIPADPASSASKKAEEKFNVYGVVEYFKPPTRTSGIDYIMVVVLSDESFQQEQINGFRCCLFGRSPEVLPKVTSIGDVLRLHRIKLVKHGGSVYGQSSPGWAGVVFPKNGDPPISTTEHFTLTEKDHRKVAKLRKLEPRLLLVPTIQNIRHGTYVDINCQVIAVKIINDERAALRVWDGTKLSSGCQTYGINEEDVPQDLRDASDGFTVDVLVFDEHKTEAESLKPGDMIKLVNVTADHGRMNPDDFGLIMRGGSSYGRGIKALDKGSCDYQTLETWLNRVRNADSDDV